ncbi:MAG: zf-HC2 domain-containing protein [Polyangiaceae bacterium]|nr:zf-HC2 domain-containing protein [Polyangiaceae bacterium]
MDCEKFDQHVMDALYDELDELTHAAMKRHMESCARCASAWNGLRATRDVGILPLEEPSEELEARILEAVAVAQKKTPWRRKALRALAWAGSHAMRPQLAMAALFVLVIGSSLLLLRARPGTVGVAPVRVTERGVPAPEQPDPAAAPAPAEAPPAVALGTAAAADTPEARRDEAGAKDAKAKGAADKQEGADGAAAELKEAQALKKSSGCEAALAKLDEIGTKYRGSPAAHAAMWEAAQCYKAAGEEGKARELLLALRSVDSYKAQAEQELADDAAMAAQQAQNAAPPAAAAAAAPNAAPAGKPAAAAPVRARASPKAAQADDAYGGNQAPASGF